jgi:hypothetical protein
MVELFVPFESGNQAFLSGGKGGRGIPLLGEGLDEDDAEQLFEPTM